MKTKYCGADNIGTFVLDPEGYMYKCWCDVGETLRAVGNVLETHIEDNEAMYMRNINYIFCIDPFIITHHKRVLSIKKNYRNYCYD